MSSDPVIEVTGLGVAFGRKNRRTPAVEHVDLEIARGEMFGLAGESGSGKTTTLRAIAGLLRVDRGAIRVEDIQVQEMKRRSLRRLRSRVQMVYQNPSSSLDPRMSGFALIEEPLTIHRQCESRAARKQRVEELADLVGISVGDLQRRPSRLSGGQQQRLAIARALAVGAKILLCDEITSALDVSVQARVMALLKRLNKDLGLTVVMVSHDMAFLSNLCDRVAVMHSGRIVDMGNVDELMHSTDEYVMDLLACCPEPDPILERENRRYRMTRGLSVPGSGGPPPLASGNTKKRQHAAN